MKLIMLGTGNAAVVNCYNTCFALSRGEKYFLVDAGGGNGILLQLQKAHIPLNGIHEIFVTHAHTDHILGVIWMIRVVAQAMQKAQTDAMAPIYKKLDEAIQAVGKAEGVIYIFDLARTSIPYIGTESIDLTAKVKTQLGIK